MFNNMSSSSSNSGLSLNSKNTDNLSTSEGGTCPTFNKRDLNIEVLNQSLKTYFKQFDTDKQLFLLKNIFLKCFKIMKGDFIKTKHMMDQINREVHIQVENSRKSLNKNRKRTNHKSVKCDKLCAKKMAKIHGHKSCKLYKNLLKSADPILDNMELLKALTDQDDKIGDVKNEKLPDDLGTKMTSKAKNCNVDNKSEASSASTQNVKKIPILCTEYNSRSKFLKIHNHAKGKKGKGNKVNLMNINILPNGNNNKNNSLIQLLVSTEISRNESIQALSFKVNVNVTDSPLSIDQSCSNNGQFNNIILPSSSKVESEVIDLTFSKVDQACSYNKQRNNILPSSSGVEGEVIDLTIFDDQSRSNNGQFNNIILPSSSKVKGEVIDLTFFDDDQACSYNKQLNNILPSSSEVNVDVSKLPLSNDQLRSDNVQFKIILPSSSKVEDNFSNLTYSDDGQSCSPLPNCPIYLKYYHKNKTNFSILKNIISKHDISKSKTFRKLVSELKMPSKFILQNNTKLTYVWHNLKIRVVNQLLKEILQTLNNTKNKIIHFIAFFCRLFHNTIDTAKLSNLEIYYEFFKFANCINKCLVSYDNKMAMEWIPYVWNNFFFYGCILINNIIFNNFIMHMFVEWSKVPNIQILFKTLSYVKLSLSTNKKNIKHKYETDNIIEFKPRHPPNTIVPEHQDRIEPPKKKIKLTSDNKIFLEAQQSATSIPKRKVTIKNSTRKAKIELSSIIQKMCPNTHNKSSYTHNQSLLNDRVPEKQHGMDYARTGNEYNIPQNNEYISTEFIQKSQNCRVSKKPNSQ